MSTATYGNFTVDVDTDGYMTDPEQWNREIGTAIASEMEVGDLNGSHWKVIDFCRMDTQKTGKVPGLRRITKQTGVNMKELYVLFPNGPGKKASKIAGLSKPKSCI